MKQVLTAAIALEADRLVIAVHRAVMKRHGAEIRTQVSALGLVHPGHLYDLAEFIAAGACTVDVARRRFRYTPDDLGGLLLAQLHDDGLLDGRQRARHPLADVADWMLAVRAAAAGELWGDHVVVAQSGAAEAMAATSGELVEAFRLLPQPSTEAHRLHHLLTGLRYARLDAHIAAWEDEGLTAGEIVALSAAVATPGVALSAAVATHGSVHSSPGLLARGWLTTEGTPTPAAFAARARIEHRTNERCDPMFAELTNPERWVAALRALPPTD